MLQEQQFYGMSNWKCYLTSDQTQTSLLSFKEEQIKEQNSHGFVVLFLEKLDKDHLKVECYKKHASSILKFIVIGKFPLQKFNKFRNEVDQIIKQTALLEE